MAGDIEHIAWFEPERHIVEATAPFFARRFAQMRWTILTPERCVRWDGHTLAFGSGAKREDAPPADAAEQLWLAYYASIFNPARLKLCESTSGPLSYTRLTRSRHCATQPSAAANASSARRQLRQCPVKPRCAPD